MIAYKKFTLENGLRVIVHEDENTHLAVMNILYNVGAKDEREEKTGFAHLFEHLMFGGSKNIENFDAPLQMAGGECNAFTSNDITNYYDTLPSDNLEVAFWLESDRMLELAFTDKSLEVQRNVVIEEFKQRYLNQPYGDVWLELRPLIYNVHPYKWPTIGKKIEHIEEAKMEDVKAFFYNYYSPENAIMVVAGNVNVDTVKELSKKYFGDIPKRERPKRDLPVEPRQTEKREKLIQRDVPANAFYMAFRMGNRASQEHYIGDLTSDILGNGKTSRLYQKLIVDKELFSSISSYITGAVEEGMIIISGHLKDDVTFEEGINAVWEELKLMQTEAIPESELEKVKNKFKTAKVFGEQTLISRAMNIAFFEMLGKLDELNDEIHKYDVISAADIQLFAQKTFGENQVSILKIEKKNG